MKNKSFLELLELDPWTWTKDGDLAVLHDSFPHSEHRYNETSVRTALATVKSTRSSYATQEAWERNVRKFDGGVAMFGPVI